MTNKPAEFPIVVFSVRVYQALLAAYPTEFQKEYGSHMLQVFRDCCRHTVEQSGASGVIRLWAITLLDLIRSVIEQHTQKETDMTKSKFIRLAGWSMILGAIAFLSGLSTLAFNNTLYGYMYWNPFIDMVFGFGIFIGPIFIAIGMLGLQTRYGDVTGAGKVILLLGTVVGGLTFIVIDLLQILTPNYSTLRIMHLYILLGGALFMFLCLFIFGILALVKKPLPRWNGAPLTAGGISIAVAPILVWTFSLHSYTKNPFPSLIFVAGHIVVTVALIMLGYVLQSDTNQTALA